MSLKQEYFELVKLLNKSNKHKNLQTEIYFYINEEQTKFYIAIEEKQKILICEKLDLTEKWVESKVTSYNDFEITLARFLNFTKLESDLTKQIKSFVFK